VHAGHWDKAARAGTSAQISNTCKKDSIR
jgi:hypothetical protein